MLHTKKSIYIYNSMSLTTHSLVFWFTMFTKGQVNMKPNISKFQTVPSNSRRQYQNCLLVLNTNMLENHFPGHLFWQKMRKSIFRKMIISVSCRIYSDGTRKLQHIFRASRIPYHAAVPRRNSQWFRFRNTNSQRSVHWNDYFASIVSSVLSCTGQHEGARQQLPADGLSYTPMNKTHIEHAS